MNQELTANKNLIARYRKWVKARITTYRLTGLFLSFVTLGLLALQYFNILDAMWGSVSILYICGFLFTSNAQYQELRKSFGAAKACRIVATVFYVLTVALLVLIVLDYFYVIEL